MTQSEMLNGRPASPTRTKATLLVTPDMAATWLASANTHNRPHSDVTARAYARAMVNGFWHQSNDDICFSTDGTLLNGQTRLSAVTLAGLPVWMDFKFGMPPESQLAMDAGRARTAGEQLSLEGTTYGPRCAQIARIVLVYRQALAAGISFSTAFKNLKVTNAEIVSVVENDPDIHWAATEATKMLRHRLVSATVMASCIYLFDEQDPNQAARFFDELSTGQNASSSTYALRTRLTLNLSERNKMRSIELYAIFFKAWNAYIEGRSVKVLRWNIKSGEPFPTINKVKAIRGRSCA